MRSQPRWAAEHGATCLPLASEDSIVRSAVWIHGMCSKAMRRKALRASHLGVPNSQPVMTQAVQVSRVGALAATTEQAGSGGHPEAGGLPRLEKFVLADVCSPSHYLPHSALGPGLAAVTQAGVSYGALSSGAYGAIFKSPRLVWSNCQLPETRPPNYGLYRRSRGRQARLGSYRVRK